MVILQMQLRLLNRNHLRKLCFNLFKLYQKPGGLFMMIQDHPLISVLLQLNHRLNNLFPHHFRAPNLVF